MENAREMVMQEVKRHFKPELLNRLDEIVVFDPLSHDQLKKVARLAMKDVAVHLAYRRGVALGVTDALDVILNQSYDPVYEARQIRRWLERKVVTELPRMLIREEIDENPTVYIDADMKGEDLTYRVERNGGLVKAFFGMSMNDMSMNDIMCLESSILWFGCSPFYTPATNPRRTMENGYSSYDQGHPHGLGSWLCLKSIMQSTDSNIT